MKYWISKSGNYLEAKKDEHNEWYLPISKETIPEIIKLLEAEQNKIIKDIILKPGMKLQSIEYFNIDYEVISAQENNLSILINENDCKVLFNIYTSDRSNRNITFKKGTTLSELNKRINNWDFRIL